MGDNSKSIIDLAEFTNPLQDINIVLAQVIYMVLCNIVQNNSYSMHSDKGQEF